MNIHPVATLDELHSLGYFLNKNGYLFDGDEYELVKWFDENEEDRNTISFNGNTGELRTLIDWMLENDYITSGFKIWQEIINNEIFKVYYNKKFVLPVGLKRRKEAHQNHKSQKTKKAT